MAMATFPNTRISWPNDVSFKKRNLVAARDRAKKRLAAEIGHPSLHRGIGQRQVDLPIAVSYTHLTLPTIYSV